MKNEYDLQAEKFLIDTKTIFKAVFLKHGIHFDDDKDNRDIYEITLKRGDREFKFNFGQSIVCSGKYSLYANGNRTVHNEKPKGYRIGEYTVNGDYEKPTAYSVLACLTDYEVGDFKDFCDNFGYDNDSIKAHKTYLAVCKEYDNVKMLWSDKEIEQLHEIN